MNKNLRVGFPGMPPPPPPMPTGRPITYAGMQKSRLAWDALRKSLQSQLQELEATIVQAVEANNQDQKAEETFDPKDVSAGTKKLYTILDGLDQRLIDTLDKALNAEGPERSKHQQAAKGLIEEYRTFVASDPMVAAVDNNGFTRTRIRPTVDQTLKVLSESL
ncbi:MAG TPA: hypothetical protein VHB27_03590 [Rhodopila sp.]|uniref:hypothetical protein n=1 Tax=Rhodopila sp. TaxID=2480087 RepID=UPI002CF0CC80|nr:hypothetical protein [Rhodopila sp.]HVY14285.1 hypothetical protein [Rhodopila sp.]